MKNSNTSTKPDIPYIFDIQYSSTYDGPGVRTVVFFKGCNLDCYWCHNPEGKKPYPEFAIFEDKCQGCGLCDRICNKKTCDFCGNCVNLCLGDARRIYGKQYSTSELFDIIIKDKPFFDTTGGGVTFSGGECMLYPDYVSEISRKCKESGITVAIDTAGNVPYSSFERVLPFSDCFLYDIKAINEQLHVKGTGHTNRLILENLNRLKNDGKKIIIRVPVIPGFNDGEELTAIKEYIIYNNLQVEFLKYHTMGENKKRALEKARALEKFSR